MPLFPKPCLKCNRLQVSRNAYCQACTTERNRIKESNPERRLAKRRLYSPEYQRASRIVRANAIECHICKQGAREGDPWTADHIDAGNPNSALAPAHRSCNSARGNRPMA